MTTPDDPDDELHQLQRQLDGEDVRNAARTLLDPGEILRELGDIGLAYGEWGPVSEWQPLDLKPVRWMERIWKFGTKSTGRKIVLFTLLAPLAVYAAVESLGDALAAGPSTLLERLIGGRTCEGPRDSLARRVQHALSALGPGADRFVLSDRRLLLVKGTLFTDPPALDVISSVPLTDIAQARHRPRGLLRRRVEIRFIDDSRIVLALPVLRSPKPQLFIAALERFPSAGSLTTASSGTIVIMTRTVHLAGDPEADKLLAAEPLALLIGMLLDQQVPMETAFAGPHKIAGRLGGFDARRIAEADPDEFAALCATPPAVHRYPASMAKRIQALCAYVIETYDGHPEVLWTDGDPDGREILRRLKALPGYGDQKARIFLALLGKQFGLQAPGWREAAGDYGEEGSRRSIADVVDEQTLSEVRAYKRQSRKG